MTGQHVEVVVTMQHRYAGADHDGSDQAVDHPPHRLVPLNGWIPSSDAPPSPVKGRSVHPGDNGDHLVLARQREALSAQQTLAGPPLRRVARRVTLLS